MTRPFISIVVPTMNEEKYIRPLLESVKRNITQAIFMSSEFELIAIDNSTDSTPKILKEYRWKVVKQKTPGISAARREGVEASKGLVVICTDADTTYPDDYLNTVLNDYYCSSENVVCSYGKVFFRNGALWLKACAAIGYTAFIYINRIIRKDHVAGMNFAFRRSAYDKVGGFRTDLQTAEDVYLGLELRKVGKVKYNKKMTVYTDARRIMAEKPYEFLRHHVKNYFNMYLHGKASTNFKPVR